MKCHLFYERSADVHIQLHPKNPPSFWSGDFFFFFFCAESTLLKSLDLVATSWDEKLSGEPTIYTTAPFLQAKNIVRAPNPPPHLPQ